MMGTKKAKALQAMRKTHAGGRPRIMTPCPICGAEFSRAAFRAHLPHCAGPATRTKGAPSQTGERRQRVKSILGILR